jgi:FkbM family methyltransferase
MKLGERNIWKVIFSLFQFRHYIAFYNMLRVYPTPLNILIKYIFNVGNYPFEIKIRSPLCILSPLIYNNHDLINVNCIFCRLDYYVRNDTRYAVDIGSNIGISALYFLSRNNFSRVFLYEPVPENLKKLKHNLANFQGRYELHKMAVSSESGIFDFGVEQTGLYGGIGVETGEYIKVNCKSINEVLEDILTKVNKIDVLKIDIEGNEFETLMAINKEYFPRITTIYAEIGNHPLMQLSGKYGAIFKVKKYGPILKLIRRSG